MSTGQKYREFSVGGRRGGLRPPRTPPAARGGLPPLPEPFPVLYVFLNEKFETVLPRGFFRIKSGQKPCGLTVLNFVLPALTIFSVAHMSS